MEHSPTQAISCTNARKRQVLLSQARILQKHNLDGNVPVAFKNPVTGNPIFYIADPQHALKKVGSSLEH